MGKVFIHDQSGETIETKANARLTIHCFAGSIIKASKDNDVYEVVVDDSEKAVFTGLTHGQWNIVICDSNGKRLLETVADVVTEYEVIIDFITSTIDIVYPEGSVCTVSSNNNVEPYTAPDTTGRWTCLIHEKGTWTVNVTDGVQTKSENIEVLEDGQYSYVRIVYYAKIRVVHPIGYSCICLDSENNEIQSASTTEDDCVFNIATAGDYTIICNNKDGTDERSRSITVTEELEEVTVNLSDFNATINITYPEGAICVCTDGTTTFMAPDISGSWTCIVPIAGEWTVIIKNTMQEDSSVVTINKYGQNEYITMKFFKAFINITYPEGAVCTCTDGITTFTAPDTSGSWICSVPRTGEWLIRAVSGNRNATETVDITKDGQSSSVICEFFVAYVKVVYPSGANKVVLCHINQYGVKSEIESDTTGLGNHTFEAYQAGDYEVTVYRVEPYVGIESSARDFISSTTSVETHKQTVTLSLKYDTLPKFTYTGTYKYTNDLGKTITESSDDWNIQFLTSGALKFTKLNGALDGIDVFVLGGGGNGGGGATWSDDKYTYCFSGGGGGGGYRENSFGQMIDTDTTYAITVGGSGGASSAFGVTANGGENGASAVIFETENTVKGGTGGSDGGRGGFSQFRESDYDLENPLDETDAEDGEDGEYAFLGNIGYRYGAGGGGGPANSSMSGGGGGSDGGGGLRNGEYPDAAVNSGSGGGGGGRHLGESTKSGTGGSGIVIIRNKR